MKTLLLIGLTCLMCQFITKYANFVDMVDVTAEDRMFLRLQDADFAQILILLPKFCLNFTQIYLNLINFASNSFC